LDQIEPSTIPVVRLAGKNGNRFELTITGYQFPKIVDDEWDSNWLNVRIDVESERGNWSSTDPSLSTSDAAWLADWLDSVSESRAERHEVGFLEPNLSFELLDESADELILRVWFELESRPAWAPADGADARDLWVDLDVSRHDGQRTASELREQLQRFPPRAVAR
jgi:hypothetical protein